MTQIQSKYSGRIPLNTIQENTNPLDSYHKLFHPNTNLRSANTGNGTDGGPNRTKEGSPAKQNLTSRSSLT